MAMPMDSAAVETPEDIQSSSVRRSSRKKIQTSHYGHDTPEFSSPQSSQPENIEASDVSEYKGTEASDMNQDSEGDSSDSENLPLSHFSPKKGKKRPGKSLKQPSAKKTKAAKGKDRVSFAEGDGHGSMFDIIRAGKGALQAVVDDWIESYNENRISAMVDLIQFLIQCCGCKGIVTEEMVEEENNVNAIRKLTEEFDEDSHEYPLIMSGQAYKKFKKNFCEFIDCLIQQCQHSIVYDEFMIDKLICWLVSLSDSQVRAFRHTSTFAGMKLVASLIQIAVKVNGDLDNTQRQLDSEKQKSVSKRGLQKLEMLQNKKSQLRDNIRALEDFMGIIFRGVFVHRYRDVRPEIRSLCISEVGCWMKEYSSLFLSHKYLKYVVWTLHDQVGDVRLHAIQSLLKLYEVEEFLPQLELLTNRFKGRIVAMTLDKENDVIVEALKLVTLLFSYGELDEEDCEQVEQLVFCNHRQVSHGAGLFLHRRLMAKVESGSPSKRRASKKSEFQQKCEYMRKLADFYNKAQIHEHAAYLVDSLWLHCDILKDWKVMTSMLLEDASKEDLSDEDETALIEIMMCCCRQAATGQGPPGRVFKRLLSTKEKKTIVNDKQEMSAHFMVHLPALLGKYGTDLPKAENLIVIPQHFDLEEYTQRRLGKHFEDLLDQIDDLVQKGPEMPLLEECAKTYGTLTDNELTLRSKAEVALNKLIDSVVEIFKDAYQKLTPGKGECDDDEENADRYALEVNLRRITAFYKLHNLGAWDLYETLHTIVYNKETDPSDEVISLALISLEMSLLWGVQSLDSDNPNKRDLKTLKQRLNSFVSLCMDSLEYASTETRKQAFLRLCDTLPAFAQQLKNKCPLLSSLVYKTPREHQLVCLDFVQSYVFSPLSRDEEKEDEEDNTENELEELSSRRLVLAGFCKFIAFGIFDMSLASSVFSRYLSNFGDFGDIIKYTMAKCKELNKSAYAKTIAQALAKEFNQVVQENGFDKASEQFVALKDLAKRLVLTFGVEPSKSNVRTSMITLHRKAILYSFQQISGRNNDVATTNSSWPNLDFLDVVNECVSRLILQDKKVVLKYLQEEADKHQINPNNPGKGFGPLKLYYKSLTEGSLGIVGKPDKASKTRPLPQKAKRKLVVEDEESGKVKSLKENADSRSKDDEEEEDDDEEKGQEEEEEKDEDEVEEEQQTEGEMSSPLFDSETTKSSARQRSKRKRDVRSDDTTEDVDENRSDEIEDRQSNNKTTDISSRKRTKRKKVVRGTDTTEEDSHNGEEEPEEPDSVKASSQLSWFASQPKRSSQYAKRTYGRKISSTNSRSRVGRITEGDEVESEEDREDRTSDTMSPKATSVSPERTSRSTRKHFPDNVFDEESPVLESQTDEDLAPAF